MPDIATARTHSILSASGSPRWRRCYGSTDLIAQLPPAATQNNSYMREGKAAHKLAEETLTLNLNPATRIGHVLIVEGESVTITADMVDAVMMYVDYIREAVAVRRCELSVEKRLRLMGTDPDGREREGTADAILHDYFYELEVVDYKHGAGHLVDPVNNYQLIDYLIGAYREIAEDLRIQIQSFKMTIVQPRAPGGGIHSWVINRDEMYNEANRLQRDLQNAASPTLTPGDHCDNTFCPARASCPALIEHMQTASGIRFQNALTEVVMPELPSPIELTPQRIADIKRVGNQIRAFLEQVDEIAYNNALQGEQIPGHKLVAKRSNRKWIDDSAAETQFVALLGNGAYSQSILSPAQMEKALRRAGMNGGLVSELVHSPFTGYTLVDNSDPRPACELMIAASINDVVIDA